MRIAALSIVILLGSGNAFAQEKAGAEETKVEMEKSPESGQKAVGNYEKALGIPNAQKISEAEKSISKMQEQKGKVDGLLKDAQKENDIVRVNCVNEKFRSISGLVSVAESAFSALQAAAAANENQRAAQEYTKVNLTAQKVEQYYNEAMACVGQAAKYEGATQTKTEYKGKEIDKEKPVEKQITPQKDHRMGKREDIKGEDSTTPQNSPAQTTTKVDDPGRPPSGSGF